MPTEELKVKISADASDLKKGLGEAKRAVGGFSGELGNLAAVAGAAFGAREVFEFFKAAVNDASEAQESAVKLTAALRAQGITSKKVADEILEFSDAMQASTRYNDEAVTDAQRLLVSLGQLSGEGLQNATRATLDLAAGLGIDLQSAALLVGKAAAGSTSAFSRYGLVVKNTGDKAKDFAGVLDQIQAKFGGSATAQIEGYAGVTAQLGNSFSEIKEAIGGEMLPALTDVAKGIKAVIDAASSDETGLARFTAAVLTLGNSEALRAFNKMKEDGGLLGDDTNLSLAEGRLQKISDRLVEIGAARAKAKADQKGAGVVDVARIEIELDALDREKKLLESELPDALAALDSATGNGNPVKVVDPEAIEAAKKLRQEVEQLFQTLNSDAFDKFAAAQDRIADNDFTKMLDSIFAAPPDGNAKEIELRRTEQALSDLRSEIEFAEANPGSPFDPEFEQKAITLRARISELRAEIKAMSEDEKRAAEAKRIIDTEAKARLDAERDSMREMGVAATAAFAAYATSSEDSEERTKRLTAALVEMIVKLIVMRALMSQGMDPQTAGQLGGIAGSAAGAGAASNMHDGGVVRAHDGLMVRGPLGRDRVPIMAEHGERILSRKQNAAFEAGQLGGGGNVINLSFSSVLPADEAQLREVLRTTIIPQLANLQRQRA